MGYCMNQGETKFHIKASHKTAALAAVRALVKKTAQGGSSSWSGGRLVERGFSWVDTEAFATAQTLDAALAAWRWPIKVDELTGDVVGIQHRGEKLGDDCVLWEALAPYVESGSYIQMRGEEGAVWRWIFKDGAFSEASPTVTW